MDNPATNPEVDESGRVAAGDGAKEKWNGWGVEGKYFFLDADGHMALNTTRAAYPKFLPFLKEQIRDVRQAYCSSAG